MRQNPLLIAATVAALLVSQVSDLSAQKKFSLTIENIMRGPGLYGYEPTAVRWSGDNQRVFFQWKQASDAVNHPVDTYVVNRDGSGLRKLTDDEQRLAPPSNGEQSHDRKKEAYTFDGDLYLYDFATDKSRQLTKTAEAEINPEFTRDDKHISFTRAGNLYVMSIEDGMIEQMTEITTPGAAPVAVPAGGGRGGRGGRGGGAPPPTTEEQKGTDSQEFLKK